MRQDHDHLTTRSVFPSIPGLPFLASFTIATLISIIGFLSSITQTSSHGKTLHLVTVEWVFALCCFAQILFVRYKSVLTAAVAPPVILMVSITVMVFQLHLHNFKNVATQIAIDLFHLYFVMVFVTALTIVLATIRLFLYRNEIDKQKRYLREQRNIKTVRRETPPTRNMHDPQRRKKPAQVLALQKKTPPSVQTYKNTPVKLDQRPPIRYKNATPKNH